MAQWQKEFSSMKESPAARKMSLQNRALALRDAREAERRAFVDQMYRLQWQTSCDDGRLLDSKATIKRVMDDREIQLHQKAEIAQKLAVEDGLLMGEWKQRIDELEKRETEKEQNRRTMETEIKGMLDSQVEHHFMRKEALRDRNARDAAEELAAWKTAKEKDDAQTEQRHILSKARGIETRNFNQSRLHLRAEAAEEVKAQDMLLLNFALDKEHSELASESAKRNEEKETTKRYQEYLKVQMIKEAENFATVDAQRQAEEDKIWAKREKELQDRSDARALLWAQTDVSRQDQIRWKKEREVKERQDVFSPNGHMEELDRLEAAKQGARKSAIAMNHNGVLAQVDHKKRLAKREEQEKYLEVKIMDKVEKEHRQRLAEMSGEVKVNFPNRHTQWYS
jgi:hypothetical protein